MSIYSTDEAAGREEGDRIEEVMDVSCKPVLSVVIPTYRRNDLLARCLDAVAPGMQTLPPEHYEVVVTDDGPKGGNAQSMLAKCYPWARWTQGPRRGPAANRNHGASQAQADWIAFTDDDCIPDPGWLQAFADARREYPDAQVLEGRTVCREGLSSPFVTSPVNETGGFLWSCNLMVAATLHNVIGGFDESFPNAHLEDVDYRDRLRRATANIQFVPHAVVDHPPRPVGPILMQVQGHRSALHYARKHGVSLSALGLSPLTRARYIGRRFLNNRRFGTWVAFRFLLTRDLPESLALAYWIPKWRRDPPSST